MTTTGRPRIFPKACSVVAGIPNSSPLSGGIWRITRARETRNRYFERFENQNEANSLEFTMNRESLEDRAAEGLEPQRERRKTFLLR